MLTVTLTSSPTPTGATVTATASGGTAPYSYAWQPQAGLSFAAPTAATSAVSIWDGGTGGNTINGVGGGNTGPAFTGGSFTLACIITDSAAATVTAALSVPGADRSHCYFNADADADAIAAGVPAVLIPNYTALGGDGPEKAALLTRASIDIDRAMRYQGRKYNTINQVTEFPRVAYEPSNAILPNTGAAGIPGGSAFGSTIWDVDPATLNIVVPNNVLEAVIYQADYRAGGSSSTIDAQFKGVTSEKIGTAQKTYDLGNAALRTGLCREALQLIWKYRLTSGRLM